MTSRPAPEPAPAPTFTAAEVASLREKVPAGALITIEPGGLSSSIALVKVHLGGGETVSMTAEVGGVGWVHGSARKGDVPGEELYGGSSNLCEAFRHARDHYANPDRPRTT